MRHEIEDRFEAGEILTGELPPTPRRPPDYVQRTTQRRPDCQLKACCLICANGTPKERAVLCKYSTGAYRPGWYCERFLQRHIETE